MKAWLVISPEYGEVDPILDDGTGPMEYGRDVAYVEAQTKRDALVLGVKLMRERGDHWFRYHDGNPYAGVSVEDLTCPTHGMPNGKKITMCVRCEEHENQTADGARNLSPCG